MDDKPFWDVNPIRYTATSTNYTAVVTHEVKRMIDEARKASGVSEKKKRGRPKKEERKIIDRNRNATTELLLDTEQYRIDEIFSLLKSDGKDTVRQQAVRYLLSYSNLLAKEMAREVIDIANKMLKDVTVRSTVKVKIASDLKAFLGTDTKKKRAINTFEELRKEDGILEVEVSD